MRFMPYSDESGTAFLYGAPSFRTAAPLPLTRIYRSLATHLEKHPDVERVAIDLRGLTNTDFTMRAGRVLKKELIIDATSRACPRVAVMVADDYVFGLCRMYHSVVHDGRACITIWRDPVDAAEWLGVHPKALLTPRLHEGKE